MILLVHMLLGAAVGSLVENVYLGMLLALLSHYLADALPHIEYLRSTEKSVEKLKTKNLKKFLPDSIKTAVDFSLGIMAIFFFSSQQSILYIYGLLAVVPDSLTIVTLLFPNKLLRMHHIIHTKYVHYLTKQKKFPIFWRIATQIVVAILSMAILMK